MMRRMFVGIGLVAVSAVFLMAGCAFIQLEEELEEIKDTYYLRGTIANRSPHQADVVVVAYEDTDGGKVAVRAQVLGASSDYVIEVNRGIYFLLAFEDRNQNLEHDTGEFVGFYGAPDRIDVKPVNMPADTPHIMSDLDFSISGATPFPAGFSSEFPISIQVIKGPAVVVGQRIAFDDDKMNPDYGQMGYWQPLSFLRNVGMGIYFMDAYDPEKIPVLLVHGAVGTPLDFQTIANRIDRSRYQPWLFYYPSGAPLEKISTALNLMVMELHGRYRFETLYVVAHSMGGLVSRGFILQNMSDHGQDYIRLFISISTPWGGHRMAEKGVEQAPVAVPSWYDMVPGSPFIESVFSQNLPDSLPYYLIFSHKGNPSRFMDNNDGSVELASELDYRAQEEAVRIYGYNETHVGILSSERVLDQLGRLLAEAAP